VKEPTSWDLVLVTPRFLATLSAFLRSRSYAEDLKQLGRSSEIVQNLIVVDYTGNQRTQNNAY
jgi:hypothetical protein